jgi:hypothetical protein
MELNDEDDPIYWWTAQLTQEVLTLRTQMSAPDDSAITDNAYNVPSEDFHPGTNWGYKIVAMVLSLNRFKRAHRRATRLAAYWLTAQTATGYKRLPEQCHRPEDSTGSRTGSRYLSRPASRRE